MTMNLGVTERLQPILSKVTKLMREEVLDADVEFHQQIGKDGADRWDMNPRQVEILESLQAKAKDQGLWNFWLTDSDNGYGLTTVEYAHLAEQMGWCVLGPQVFNCSAPDTGNMEVLERYGTEEHKEKWLKPLLESKIRSAYLMTEPDVASSDATNLNFSAVLEGDEYVLNGEKYWSSGAGDKRCEVYILMAKTAGDEAPRHARHSMFAMAADTPGIEILRAMTVFGHDDAPHGHMHIKFDNVRIPKSALLLGEGRGFEVSQGRLGPGRIHHCMRAIGQAERALELMCKRSMSRTAFGKPLAKLGGNYDIIADCRIGIEQARLLCLKAAWMMDQGDPSAAAPWISQIKVVAPNMALKVIDEAIQMFGGTGISQDTPLAEMYAQMRTLRFADGPDAVHRMQVARKELSQYR
ncbi:acyl-CoA dehydrogenase family protein [Arenicella sp. 4NH20-0111]|uniref:acyl-CoA dehydrogenase family protein n=1 Tax=Arenicella sp. 4NH20-0111 TaxID=3127648 RepID=UPI00310A0A5E